MHARPQILMRLAAPRWKDEQPAASYGVDAGDNDALVRQTQRALLELSQALDYIRPQPPAWTFAPIVRYGTAGHDSLVPRPRCEIVCVCVCESYKYLTGPDAGQGLLTLP
jgi:hypothetical protein